MDQGHLRGIKKAIEGNLTGGKTPSGELNRDVQVMITGSQNLRVLQAQCGKGPHPFPSHHTPSQGDWNWPGLEAENSGSYIFGQIGIKLLKMGVDPQIRLFNLGLSPSLSPHRHTTWLPHLLPTFRINLASILSTSELIKLQSTYQALPNSRCFSHTSKAFALGY